MRLHVMEVFDVNRAYELGRLEVLHLIEIGLNITRSV